MCGVIVFNIGNCFLGVMKKNGMIVIEVIEWRNSFFYTEVNVHVEDLKLSRLMGKPTICIGESKDADQLRGKREADQRLCFLYSDRTIPLLLQSEISSF